MEKTLTKKSGTRPTGLALSETIDRWLGDVLGGRLPSLFSMPAFDWQPTVDIREIDSEVIISASLPGVDKKDISVEVTDHTLTIRGERKEESEEKMRGGYVRREQAYGSFYRSFDLPENIKTDQIKASDRNGVLEIRLPKTENKPALKGRAITIE
jgi:HSP20 family protein